MPCAASSSRAHQVSRVTENVDARIFIDRTRLETRAAREKRGREPMDPFIEEVLEIEHAIISAHKARADIVITRDYRVEHGAPRDA